MQVRAEVDGEEARQRKRVKGPGNKIEGKTSHSEVRVSLGHKSSRMWQCIMFRTTIKATRHPWARRIRGLTGDHCRSCHHDAGAVLTSPGPGGDAGGCLCPCLGLQWCLRHHSLRMRAR